MSTTVSPLSNDGLTFTTPNWIGPKGDTGEDGEPGLDYNGSLPKGYRTTWTMIQIGNGLWMMTQLVLSVDINDVPDQRYYKTFELIYIDDTPTTGWSQEWC